MRVVLAFTFLLVTFAVGVWDIYAVAKGRPEDTVSVTLHAWSIIYPILPLAIGLVIGHIFWPTVSVTVALPK